MRKTTLRVRADVSHGDVHSFGEMVCGVGWDRDGEYVATVGVSRRVRVFELRRRRTSAPPCSVPWRRCRPRASSPPWRGTRTSRARSRPRIMTVACTCGTSRARLAAEMHKHKNACGRCISPPSTRRDSSPVATTARCACGASPSATPRRRSRRERTCARCSSLRERQRRRRRVGGLRGVRVRLRHASRPLVTLSGHRRAASYVRWMGGDKIVTASTDNTLKLWDVKRGMTLNLNPNTSATPRARACEPSRGTSTRKISWDWTSPPTDTSRAGRRITPCVSTRGACPRPSRNRVWR